MKITVKKDELKAALDLISTVAVENKIRPVISGCFLRATDKIELIGTNLERTIMHEIDGEVQQEGECVFSYKELVDYLSLEQSRDIDIIVDEFLNVGDAKFPIYSADEYPKLKFELKKECDVSVKDLNEALSLSFASAQQPDNLAIHGIRFDFANNTVAASDSFRMASKKIEVDSNIEATLPLSSVQSLKKALSGVPSELSVEIYQESTQIGFKIDNTVFYSRLIDLAFPDYLNIIKQVEASNTFEIHANTKDLKNKLKKVLVFTRNNIEAKNAATFTISGKQMTMKGIGQKGRSTEKIEIYNPNNLELKTSLNCKFLCDYIDNHNKEAVVLKFQENQGAAVMIDTDIKGLMMPLALRNE